MWTQQEPFWWIPGCSIALLLCHTCPSWSSPMTWCCSSTVITGFCPRVILLCCSCSSPPYLLSFSGVCSAPGGERRLLRSRFVANLFSLFLHEDATASGQHAFTCDFLPSSSAPSFSPADLFSFQNQHSHLHPSMLEFECLEKRKQSTDEVLISNFIFIFFISNSFSFHSSRGINN